MSKPEVIFNTGLSVALATLLTMGSATAQTHQPQGIVLSSGEDSPKLVAIREKLSEPVTLEFVETPLGDVVSFLRHYTHANIVIDGPALAEEGVTRDTPVSIHVDQIKLSSALNHLLGRLNLTWVLKDDCLIFTSQLAAGTGRVTRSYPVGDLALTSEDGAQLVALAGRLLQAAEGTVFSKERLPFVDPLKAIVFTDNYSRHDLLARLFEQLRGGVEEPESVKKIKLKLENPVTLEFVETPLSDVVAFLKDFTGLNIVHDGLAFEEEGVSIDTPVSIHVQDISMRSALGIMLSQFNLTFTIDDECLLITGKPAAESHFQLQVYSVAKLLGSRAKLTRDEWVLLARSVLAGDASSTGVQKAMAMAPIPFGAAMRGALGSSGETKKVYPQTMVDFYEPQQLLVVFGPASTQKNVHMLIQLIVKTAEQTGD